MLGLVFGLSGLVGRQVREFLELLHLVALHLQLLVCIDDGALGGQCGVGLECTEFRGRVGCLLLYLDDVCGIEFVFGLEFGELCVVVCEEDEVREMGDLCTLSLFMFCGILHSFVVFSLISLGKGKAR